MFYFITQCFTLFYFSIEDDWVCIFVLTALYLTFIIFPLEIIELPDYYNQTMSTNAMEIFPYYDISFIYVFYKSFCFKKIKFSKISLLVIQFYPIFNFVKSLFFYFFIFWRPLFKKLSYIIFFFKK